MPPMLTVPGDPSLSARVVPLQRLRVLVALIVRGMNAKFGRSVGGSLGGSVGRAIVRGALGSILRR